LPISFVTASPDIGFNQSTPQTGSTKKSRKKSKKIIWDRQIDFDPDQGGSTKFSRPWIKKTAIFQPKRFNEKGEGLGLGLSDWESHCSAIRISWLLKYKDATDAPWKSLLDVWFANTILDRGAVFSSLPAAELTAHLNSTSAARGIPSYLSNFWIPPIQLLEDRPQRP
jgi:hypothetical protein